MAYSVDRTDRPRHFLRYLAISADGDCKVYVRPPDYSPNVAVFKLTITMPPSRLVSGEIQVNMPAMPEILADVSYVDNEPDD